MAITITAQPTASATLFYPITNQLKYVVNSNNADIVNIIADVLIAIDPFSTFNYRLTVTIPANGSGNATFYIDGIVADYLKSIRNEARLYMSSSAVGLTEYMVQVRVKFYEEYEDVDGLLTTTWAENAAGTGAVTSGDARVFNFAFNQYLNIDGSVSDYANYYKTGASTRRFLTRVTTRTIPKDIGYGYLMFHEQSDTDYYEIKYYSAAGALLSTQTFSVGSNQWRIVGFGGYTTSLTIPATAKYFTVKVYNSTPTLISNTITFYIDDCGAELWNCFTFYNSFGGVEELYLKTLPTVTTDVKKNTFSQFSTTAVPEEKAIFSDISRTYEIEGWIGQNEESLLMAELLESPMVYHHQYNEANAGWFFSPIIIEDGSYTVLDRENNQTRIKFSFRLAKKYITSR